MNTPSTPLRRWLLLASLGLATGCPSEPNDTGSPVETDSDVQDTDPCPGAPTREAFVRDVVPDFCAFAMTCPEPAYPTQEECERVLGDFYTSKPCFQRCPALECAVWASNTPNCTDPVEQQPAACAEAAECTD